MDVWNIMLFAAAVYVAVISLVRMMRARQKELIKRFRKEFDREQQAIAERITLKRRKEREEKRTQMFDDLVQKRDAA
ncbi:MAG: hypothetical protein COA78_16435 [Blastopirellula sp.]|nr:MAG: hypothetical protein COA78_16435 [Blastopirellula sp.]